MDARGDLAGARFYEHFYRHLLTKFSAWSDLPSAWRDEKQPVVDLLYRSMHAGARTLLSVGCGIGFVEHELLQRGLPPENLFLNEISENPLSWIRRELAQERIYVGRIPECLPAQKKWDIVYFRKCGLCIGTKGPGESPEGTARTAAARQKVHSRDDGPCARPIGQTGDNAYNQGVRKAGS